MSAAILERIREILDQALPRGQAPKTLFAALAAWGPRVPASASELAAFAAGPLKDALGDQLAGGALKKALAALDEVVATASAPTADREIPIEVEVPIEWSEEPSTSLLRTVAGPVPVLVVARSTALALRLRLALGPETIDLEVRSDRASVERALTAGPVLVVIDASDEASIAVEPLADALAHATKTSTIVWGAERPAGQRLVDAAEARGLAVAGLATSEGIGAIFDLVVSRRG